MPKTPESGDHSSTMDLLVDAATSYLQECQTRSIDVEEIARRAGVDPALARTVCPTNEDLGVAIDTYGMLRASDVINKALVAAQPGDNRGALIGLIRAYLDWARANPMLYLTLATRTIQFPGENNIVRRYDASFVPLVRRYLGESEDAPSTRRAAVLRGFLLGLAHLALDGHLSLWTLPNVDVEAEITATIEDFVDLLLSAPSQPIRSEA